EEPRKTEKTDGSPDTGQLVAVREERPSTMSWAPDESIRPTDGRPEVGAGAPGRMGIQRHGSEPPQCHPAPYLTRAPASPGAPLARGARGYRRTGYPRAAGVPQASASAS